MILITDGKSHALDVQELARSGCRFTVVLIGEDSLEANAGHLAALTGGSIFAALGADTAASVTAAIASVRAGPGGRRVKSEAAPSEIVLTRSGLRIGAAWSKVPANATCTDEEHAVAALAASLLLPDLDEAAALELALAEGLVGHLTSLVLVDEDGPATGDHAANRKIALPSPRTAAAAGGMMTAHMRAGPQVMYALAGAPAPAPAPKAAAGSAVPLPPPPARDLATLAHDIDWQMRPQRLIAGDVSVLPPEVAAAVVAAAKTTALETAARRLGIVAAALVIGLMARALAGNDRLAGRIARAILKTADAKLLDELAQRLGLLSATMRTAAGR